MEFLVRFVQMHESFRKPELEALAILANVDMEIVEYSEYVGFIFTFGVMLCRFFPFSCILCYVPMFLLF